MKKMRLTGVVKHFAVDFNPIDTSDTFDIYEYLMKRT